MEKKNTGLIITIIVLVICLLCSIGFIVYDMSLKKKTPQEEEQKVNVGKYLCIDKSMSKGDLLYLNSLSRCDNKDSITKKDLESNGIDLNDNEYYINVDKNKGSALSLSDIYWKLQSFEHNTNYNQKGDTISAVINNGKLLINDIVVFDQETVISFSERKVCCAGEYFIILLTESGNVYFSENDISNLGIDYNIDDVVFVKQDIQDIVEFHESINVNDDYLTTMITAIDKQGNSFVID